MADLRGIRKKLLSLSKLALIKKLKGFNLNVNGTKQELVDRLLEYPNKNWLSNLKNPSQQNKKINKKRDNKTLHLVTRCMNPLGTHDTFLVIKNIIEVDYSRRKQKKKMKTKRKKYVKKARILYDHTLEEKIQKEEVSITNDEWSDNDCYVQTKMAGTTTKLKDCIGALEYMESLKSQNKFTIKLNRPAIHEFNSIVTNNDFDERKCNKLIYISRPLLDDRIIKEYSLPVIIAQINNKLLPATRHLKFRDEMNEFEESDFDIKYDYKDYGENKGKVHELIDPSKHLSTLFIDNKNINFDENYQEWIPTTFMYTYNFQTPKYRMSDIPNLNGYKYETLNKLIGDVLIKMIPMFENVLLLKLNSIPLRFIISARSYMVSNLDVYKVYMHKDGIFEDIIATGIYYYYVDEQIDGGDLELHHQIEADDGYDEHGWDVAKKRIKIKEGQCIVFNNYLSYHKYSKLFLKEKYKTQNEKNTYYSRKIISFFLINPKEKEQDNIDSSTIVTNWKSKMIQITSKWWDIRKTHETGYKWLFDVISEYMVGTNEFIKTQTLKHKECKKIYCQNFRRTIQDLREDGEDYDSTGDECF